MTDTTQHASAPDRRFPRPRDDFGTALAALSDEDLLRLRAIARLRARSLPSDVTWSDLLQEAVCRALSGTRSWPAGVSLLTFLAGIMRSLCSEHWRRQKLGQALAAPDWTGGPDDPERTYAATQALAAIHRLFASDGAASAVITGLIGGMTAEEIRCHYGLTAVEYDTTRRRIRRAMLRHGLAWTWS